MFKTKRKLYSRKRFSAVCQISYRQFFNQTEEVQKKIQTKTSLGYGVTDYKTGKLFLIEYISAGRWKFLGKHFNKLDDVNKQKYHLITKYERSLCQ